MNTDTVKAKELTAYELTAYDAWVLSRQNAMYTSYDELVNWIARAAVFTTRLQLPFEVAKGLADLLREGGFYVELREQGTFIEWTHFDIVQHLERQPQATEAGTPLLAGQPPLKRYGEIKGYAMSEREMVAVATGGYAKVAQQ